MSAASHILDDHPIANDSPFSVEPPSAEPRVERERTPTLDGVPATADGDETGDAYISGAHPIAPPLLPGMTIAGRYLVDAAIGTGGHGAVFRATHLTLDLPVAVKVLGVGTLSTSDKLHLTERFTREARTIALIRHRNVLAIHDAGLLGDGSPFLVTELIEGEDLEHRISRSPLSIGAAVDLGRQLFAALTALAEGGILHRDVKPANVMLHREADAHVLVKLIDFGIAREKDEGSRLTVTGQIVGTPHYMAPEQLRGEQLDGRADLYAACVVLYEALTGRPPFDGESAPLVIGKILGGAFEPIATLRPDCPAELASLIERGLSRARSARPAHPLAVVNELDKIAQRLGLATGALAWAEDKTFGHTLPLSPLRVRSNGKTPPDGAPTHDEAPLPAPDSPEPVTPDVPGRVEDPPPASVRWMPRVVAALSMGALGVAMGLALGTHHAPVAAGAPLAAPVAVVAPVASAAPPVLAVAAPIDVTPMLRRGLESLASGEVEQALANYRSACEADPDRPEAHRGRGLAASRAGLDDEAILAFERYLSLAPDAGDGARVRDRLRGLRARRGQRTQRGH